MLFTNPIWLWALAGLSIPVGIHLLSRKEGKVIRIGSIRHLQETNTQQFKGIRLNEIVLLTLRCLLIIIFVLLISGLSVKFDNSSETKWVLVEKGLENKAEIKEQLSNFKKQGYELRWLAPSFRMMEDSSNTNTSAQYWKLLENLNQQNISEAIVIAKNRIEGFTGLRTPLPSNIRWISVASDPTEFTLRAIAMSDSIVIRSGETSSAETSYNTQTFSMANWNKSGKLIQPDTIRISMISDVQHQYDKKILMAALKTIDQAFPVVMEINFINADEIKSMNHVDWLIWLSDKPISDFAIKNVMYSKPGFAGNIFIQEKTNRWTITKRLNEEIALNNNLVIQLASILIPSDKSWEVAKQHDIRMLPDSIAWDGASKEERNQAAFTTQSAENYLIALLLIALLIERLLAYYRNQ